jgi:hypothetical protein
VARAGKRRTQYTRDNSGKFASTPGGGPSSSSPAAVRKAAKAAAVKGKGSLAARTSLKKSKAKLATSSSVQQKGAVTRGQKAAKKAIESSKTKLKSSEKSKLRKNIATSLTALAKSKKKTAKKVEVKPTAKKVNLAAERAKRMASRTGVVPGGKFESGKSVKTMSLKDMRSAVVKAVKGGGKAGMAEIAMAAGTGQGLAEIKTGRMPKTRSEWERAYRSLVKAPMSDRGRKERPGIVNGIDIHKNFRPWAVFGLDPKKASKQDVNQAYRRVAKKVHPDVGGRVKDFERIKKMRDSIVALMQPANTAKGKGKRAKSTGKSRPSTRSSSRSNVKLLPPARS